MGAVVDFVLQSGIFWILLIMMGTLVGSWLLVIYWEYGISRALENFAYDNERMQGEINEILQEIQSYSPDDPLPYGPMVSEIHRAVDSIANRLAALNQKKHLIAAQHHKMSSRPVQYILAAPIYIYTWYRTKKDTISIQAELVELQDLVENAWAQERELDKQAWLLASRVRAAITKQQNVRQMMDYLGDQKLYGDTFEAMVEIEDLVMEAIDHIPDYFLLDEEDNISAHAGKLDVWVVHKILSESEPILEDMHEKLSLWIRQYDQLAEKVDHHMDQLAHFEHLVNAAPEGVDLVPQKTQLAALGDTLKVLSDTLGRLEVESIGPVERELDQVQRIIADNSVLVRQGYNDFAELQQQYPELTKLQADVSLVFEMLVRSPTYPIIWDRSNKPFRGINKRVNDLSSPDKPRTLEELRVDANLLQELLEGMRVLKSQVYRIKGTHEDLLVIFTSDEILHGLDKIQEYYQLGEQIFQYDPDNWLKPDSPSTFLDEIQILESAHNAFLGREHTANIPESEIGDWLHRADDLVNDHKQLKVRSEKLLVRLQFIKSTENEAKDLLAIVQKAVNQLKWLVNSNIFLKGVAATDIEKITPRLLRCGAQLGESHTGKIEDKLRSVQSLRDEVDNAGRKWLERLNQDIDQQRSLLTGKLEMIANIASLDDPAVSKAKYLLENSEGDKKSSPTVPAFHLQFEDIISAIKSGSAVWQELVAVQTELEELVETPLIDAYNHAEDQRKLALDALVAASRIIPETRQWPPCSVSISDERVEMERLESVRSAIASKNTRAIWAVRQYGELAASYQTLTGKIERSKDWAMHEQKRITDLEREIGNLNRGLQQREQSSAGNPDLVEEYRRLRAQANLSIERQKQRWTKSRPGLPEAGDYEDILHSLVETERVLRVSVDTLMAGSRPER